MIAGSTKSAGSAQASGIHGVFIAILISAGDADVSVRIQSATATYNIIR